MAKGFPRQELLAEPLHGLQSVGGDPMEISTHASDLPQVAVGIYPQHLDCHLLAMVFALPYIRKAATAVRDAGCIVARLDSEKPGKHSVASTHLV